MFVILLPVAVLLAVKAARLFFYWIRDNYLVAKQLATPPVDNIIVGHASVFNDVKVHRKMQELGQRYGNFRLRTLHLQVESNISGLSFSFFILGEGAEHYIHDCE